MWSKYMVLATIFGYWFCDLEIFFKKAIIKREIWRFKMVATQSFFENNVHVSEFVVLNAMNPMQFPVVFGEVQNNILQINKPSRKVHFVFESVAAWNDPIIAADIDIFIYYGRDHAAAFYQHLVFSSADGRIAVLLENFMGVKFVYMRQNSGTAVRAQIVFE